MDERIRDLVRRIALPPPPPRVISPDEYRAIECNRCGDCCEDIRAIDGPETIDAMADDPANDADRRRFLAGLLPVGKALVGWRYRCRHFSRDGTGLGVCGVYGDRPAVCRWFPGGHTVRVWPKCAWYVEVRDETGALIPFVPEVLEGRPSGARTAPVERDERAGLEDTGREGARV